MKTVVSTAPSDPVHSRWFQAHKKKNEIFDKFSWIKKGSTIYIGNKKAALESSSFKSGWARPIKVLSVRPRKKEWIVSWGTTWSRSNGVVLTPAMAQMLKVSHESNPEALADAVSSDTLTFRVGGRYILRKLPSGSAYGCDQYIGREVTALSIINDRGYVTVSRPDSSTCLIVYPEMLEPI